MKRLFILLAFVASLFASPAIAGETKSKTLKAPSSTSSYAGKKDKAYWTRVWYEKQARKGKKYKNRVYKKSRRKSVKRSSKKRSVRAGSGRVLAKVNLSNQTMTVYQGGRVKHVWKVSSGRKGYTTPTGTWKIHRMHKEYYSKKYHGAPMPYAMFYHRGFAVHGTNAISRLGRTASHGCVRLHPSNAAQLFAMVRRNGGTVKVTY
jgi:lipoprotein-anchoring transpeptidase ErfK/SrfK